MFGSNSHEDFIEAARVGDVERVKAHMERDPDFSMGLDDTPLTAAVKSASYECVQLILPFSAVDGKDQRGRSALITAAMSDRVEIAELLLAAGASLTQVDRQKHTALGSAASNDATRCAMLLARLTPDIDDPRAASTSGMSAACIACYAGSHRALAALLSLGANATAPTAKGASPLTLAATFGHAQCIATLLESPHPVEAIEQALRAAEKPSFESRARLDEFRLSADLLRTHLERRILSDASHSGAAAAASRPRL